MRRLAIVVGHNRVSQGAVRPDTGESEYVYNSRLAQYMEEIAPSYGLDVKVFYRVPSGGYTREINRVYAEVDNWRADGSIELHFNASANPSATGTETFSSGSARSILLAQEVQMEMVESLGLRDRGIKIRNSRTKGRGYKSLVSGRAPAILVEPFFASSARGMAASDSPAERENLAASMLEGAKRALEQF